MLKKKKSKASCAAFWIFCLFSITLAKVSYRQNPKSKAKCMFYCDYLGGPGGLVVKNPPASAGDARDSSSFPGSGRSPGEGNDNPLQYSCLENPMDRGTWCTTLYGVAWTEQLTQQQKEMNICYMCICTQSCLTLYDPMYCSPPGSSIHGIFQTRILEWVVILFSSRSSRPRDRTQFSRIADWAFPHLPSESPVNICCILI